MKEFKNPITIRQGHLTCSLPLSLESYWECEADCIHCMGRRLNQVWGKEQRVTDPEKVKVKLLKSQNSKSKTLLAQALRAKKAFFFGRKADPYQPLEIKTSTTRKIVKILHELDWPYALCSRYQSNMERDTELFVQSKENNHILVEITPGGELDWERFEKKRTTPVDLRLKIAKQWVKLGLNVGIRGEPFIPSVHNYKQFKDTLKLLKSHGLKSYNTFNLHLNHYTLKRLHENGFDIEAIWEGNQDINWKKTQRKLCDIANKIGVELGCPDFVNVPKNWVSKVNTCCGMDVKNAFTYNTQYWRQLMLSGKSPKKALEISFENISCDDDIERAKTIVYGKENKEYYTFKDSDL